MTIDCLLRTMAVRNGVSLKFPARDLEGSPPTAASIGLRAWRLLRKINRVAVTAFRSLCTRPTQRSGLTCQGGQNTSSPSAIPRDACTGMVQPYNSPQLTPLGFGLPSGESRYSGMGSRKRNNLHSGNDLEMLGGGLDTNNAAIY